MMVTEAEILLIDKKTGRVEYGVRTRSIYSITPSEVWYYTIPGDLDMLAVTSKQKIEISWYVREQGQTDKEQL